MNVLVSGIASDIGFNCGRILKELDGVEALHGIDIHPNHPGSFVFDACAVAPRADQADYEDWIAEYITNNKIDFFLPTSEAEISRVASSEILRSSNVRIVIANRQVIENSLDKYRCLNFLDGLNVSVPQHGIVGDTMPPIWPVVVKPRSGQGSKDIAVVSSFSDLHSQAAGCVWQEQLLPADQEYTCPIYRSHTAGTRILVLRRTLQGGLTVRGEVVDNREIVDYVEAIADALDLNGAMNVQLRLTRDGPLLFEINPRLSSTVMFRHKMGFSDLKWWLTDLAGMSASDYIPVTPGTRFFRGSAEYICG
jgi:carbamoyl-phosphate synthase large subunit